MANLDYESENTQLSVNLRAYMGATERVTASNYDDFIMMFDDGERLAVSNNIIASKFARGFTKLNYSNLTSGSAPRLMSIKVQKSVGKVYFQALGDGEKNIDARLPKQYLNKVLKKASYQANATGRSLMVVYRKGDDNNSRAFVDCFNLYRHKIKKDAFGEIVDALLFVERNQVKYGNDYYVVEHRFYNNDHIPCSRLEVVKCTYGDTQGKNLTRTILDTIPADIEERYNNIGIKFNVTKVLDGFIDLGCYEVIQNEVNLKFPDADIPETMFNIATDTIVSLENGLTGREVEKQQGRGQVLIPEFQKQAMGIMPGKQGNVANSFIWGMEQQVKNPILVKYPTRSAEDNKPQSVQFDIRADQWEQSINGDIGRLCSLVGISILDYDPRLLMTGQRTDDEINSMTDITRATVDDFRELNEYEINKMIKCVATLFGINQNIAIRWSMSSILNPTKNGSLVVQKFTNGLISRSSALKELNPDLTDDEIQDELNKINEDTKANEVNVDSTFENF